MGQMFVFLRLAFAVAELCIGARSPIEKFEPRCVNCYPRVPSWGLSEEQSEDWQDLERSQEYSEFEVC